MEDQFIFQETEQSNIFLLMNICRLTWLVIKEFDMPILVSGDSDRQRGMTHHFIDMIQRWDSWVREKEKGQRANQGQMMTSMSSIMSACGLTAVSLTLQHQCGLGSLQVIYCNVAVIKGRHHVGGVTTVEIHRCRDSVLCREGWNKVLLHYFLLCFHSSIPDSTGWTHSETDICPLTIVCVKSADAGFFLHQVPQFHRSVGRAGQEAVLDAAVGQSPHGVCMSQQRTGQDAGVCQHQQGKARTEGSLVAHNFNSDFTALHYLNYFSISRKTSIHEDSFQLC